MTKNGLHAWFFCWAALLTMPASAAFTTNSDNTVTDSTTGLIWDLCAWGQTPHEDPCDEGTAAKHDFAQAASVVAAGANALGGYKGHSDWRVPTLPELRTLIAGTQCPAIASPPFVLDCAVESTPYRYWTSTVWDEPGLWLPGLYADFSTGATDIEVVDQSNGVRLVRGGTWFRPFATGAAAPAIVAVAQTSAALQVTSAAQAQPPNGTYSVAAANKAYYVVIPRGSAEAPNAAQIYGANSSATMPTDVAYQGTISAKGSGSIGAAASTLPITGLAPGTSYDLYLIGTNTYKKSPASTVMLTDLSSVDASGNAGGIGVVKLSFTTQAAPTYAITATANPAEGGTINCTPNPVNANATSSCSVSTNADYKLGSVSGCGGTPGTASTYTTGAINAPCTVTANFAQKVYTDNGDGTVTDSATGLMWDQCVLGETLTTTQGSPEKHCTGAPTLATWPLAFAGAAEANTSGRNGYRDWRVPTKDELLSLVSKAPRACWEYPSIVVWIDLATFPETPCHYSRNSQWTSTYNPDPQSPGFAWYLVLRGTPVLSPAYVSRLATYSTMPVRLVRGGRFFDPFASGANSPAVTAASATAMLSLMAKSDIAHPNSAITAHYLVVPRDAAAPYAAQVFGANVPGVFKNGKGAYAGSVVAKGSGEISTSGTTLTITGLVPDTAYDLYLVGANAYTNDISQLFADISQISAPATPGGAGVIKLSFATPSSAPTVTNVSPSAGTALGGTPVTITGTNFTADATVNFGAWAASNVVVVDATKITATTPAGAGTVHVTVTTANGTSTTSASDQYTFVAAPAITQLRSNNGLLAGGGPVTILGSGFSGATQVMFGGIAATSFSVFDDHSMFAFVPASATPGAVNVSVTTPGGTSADTPASQYTYIVPSYVVNSTADSDGTEALAHCDANSATHACTLYDAVELANFTRSAPTITFDATVFPPHPPTPATITLANTLSIYTPMRIVGPGARALFVTVSDADATSVYVSGGTPDIAISGMTIGGGDQGVVVSNANLRLSDCILTGNSAIEDSGKQGAGLFVNFQATATVSGCTITGNRELHAGGGIYNQGNLTLINSTVAGNYAGQDGGGIYLENRSAARLTLINSTVAGNAAVEKGGGIAIAGDGAAASVVLANALLSTNIQASTGGDLETADGVPVSWTDHGGNVVGGTAAALAPLGDYGGSGQTPVPIPLPGSSAICAGTPAPSGGESVPDKDQRGMTRPTSAYPVAQCVDAGAVQTSYALTFSTEPGPVQVGATMAPAPVVALEESGAAFNAQAYPTLASAAFGDVALTDAAAVLNPASTTQPLDANTGSASFPALSFNAVAVADSLRAQSWANVAAAIPISATSAAFDVTALAPQTLSFGAAPRLTYGSTATVTVTSTTPNSGNPVTMVSTTPAVCSIASGTSSASGATGTVSASAVGTCTLAASQPAGAGYAAASASLDIVVAKAGQTIAFTTPPPVNPQIGGTYSIGATGGGSNNPVTFSIASASSGVCSIAGNTVTFLGAGACAVNASQTGDANYADAAPQQQIIHVGLATTSTVVQSSVNPGVYGQSVIFTATVASNPAPTGTIDFTDGATALCVGVALAGGTATCSTNTLGVGAHTITARYSGDASTAASSAALTQTVGASATLTTLDSPGAITLGQPVTLGVRVAAQAPGTGTPGGKVTISDGAVSCTATLASGSGNCTLTPPAPAGSHTITAAYAGSPEYAASTGTTALTVDPAAGAFTLTSSANPSHFSHAVTFTATVTSNPAPTGTIDFSDGATALCVGVALAGGTATCSTNTLGVGAHTITVRYSGDANHPASNATLTQTVEKDITTMTLSANPNPAAANQAIVLSAIVLGDPPSGPVTFFEGTAALGASQLAVTGPLSSVATLTVGPLKPGTHHLSATYAGDANNHGSTSAVLAVTVSEVAVQAVPAPMLSPASMLMLAVILVLCGLAHACRLRTKPSGVRCRAD